MKIIALSGSLRAASFNTRLTHLLSEEAGEGIEVVPATVRGIPLYDGDLEASDGIPEAVEALRAEIKRADGLVSATPEYNAGMPGVLTNGLTRPGEEMKPTFGQRPTGLVGATPGGWGTAFAQAGALINLRQLGVELYPGYLRISGAGDGLAENEISDQVRKQSRDWLAGFVEFARKRA